MNTRDIMAVLIKYLYIYKKKAIRPFFEFQFMLKQWETVGLLLKNLTQAHTLFGIKPF